MSTNSTKKQKWAFPVGLLVVILAAIGLITVIVAGVKGVDIAIDKTKRYEEYEKIKGKDEAKEAELLEKIQLILEAQMQGVTP